MPRGLDLGGHYKIIKEAIEITRKYQDLLIEERVQQEKAGYGKDPEDLLDILVSLKDASSGEPLLSLEEIKAQVTVTPSLSLSRKQGLLPKICHIKRESVMKFF
ncbi:hypothetical protein CerSpe_200730 [Prunus speciosa]